MSAQLSWQDSSEGMFILVNSLCILSVGYNTVSCLIPRTKIQIILYFRELKSISDGFVCWEAYLKTGLIPIPDATR